MFIITSVGTLVISIISVVQTARPPVALMIGQAFFLAGIWLTTGVSDLSWRFTDDGIIGPVTFLPWAAVTGYEWHGPTLVVHRAGATLFAAWRLRLEVQNEDVRTEAERVLRAKAPNAAGASGLGSL